MDVSPPQPAPRMVPDLRPTADAAATLRADRPPAAVAPSAPTALPEPVSRSVFEARAVAVPEAAGCGRAEPPRVLKPWGVQMLPAGEGREAPDGRDGVGGEAADTRGPGAA